LQNFNFANQLHDYEPGITADGLFWTIPIPSESVAVSLRDGTARMQLTHAPIPDFTNFPNAVGLIQPAIPPVPATVSFDLRWSGVTNRTQLRNADERFVALVTETGATVEWSSSQEGFSFVSDPANTSTSIYAAIGRESNGVFFDFGI
jgi:hypothetical protein